MATLNNVLLDQAESVRTVNVRITLVELRALNAVQVTTNTSGSQDLREVKVVKVRNISSEFTCINFFPSLSMYSYGWTELAVIPLSDIALDRKSQNKKSSEERLNKKFLNALRAVLTM